MKTVLYKISTITLLVIAPFFLNSSTEIAIKDFQGKATYMSKTKMDLGTWGARLTELQKKQVQNRMKARLEKTYVLTFNAQESFFKEEEKLDAISGATDSWGKYFTPGDSYKNVKTNDLIQSQEFYGKAFLVKDKLQTINWELGSETKQIGSYLCYKATAYIPTDELTWVEFSWSKLRNQAEIDEKNKDKSDDEKQEEVTLVEAWYSPQIPVSNGPLEYWGLPGLILEVSAGNATLLCTEIVLNPTDKIEIEAPKKGEVVTKKEYQEIVIKKMQDFREMRSGRGNRGR